MARFLSFLKPKSVKIYRLGLITGEVTPKEGSSLPEKYTLHFSVKAALDQKSIKNSWIYVLCEETGHSGHIALNDLVREDNRLHEEDLVKESENQARLMCETFVENALICVKNGLDIKEQLISGKYESIETKPVLQSYKVEGDYKRSHLKIGVGSFQKSVESFNEKQKLVHV